MVADIHLSISSLSGRSFAFDVKASSQGYDVKLLICTMDCTYRVSMVRLLYGSVEIQDECLLSDAIHGSSGQLNLLIRRPACEQFLLEYQGDRYLEDASDEVKEDRECVLSCILSGRAFEVRHASLELRNDKEIGLAAVKQSGETLEYVSEALRDDIEVVFAAVENNGAALEYASAALQDDFDVVLAAILQCSRSCSQFASERLRGFTELILLDDAQHDAELSFFLRKDYWSCAFLLFKVFLIHWFGKFMRVARCAYGAAWSVLTCRALIASFGAERSLTSLLLQPVLCSIVLSLCYALAHLYFTCTVDSLCTDMRPKRDARLIERLKRKVS